MSMATLSPTKTFLCNSNHLGLSKMSIVVPQQLPPPPMGYAAHSGHASIGPLIGVLAVVLILCAVAVVIGRLCSGRTIMGYGHYDMESWVETKCSSCVDGRILVSPPAPPPVRNPSNGGAPAEASSTPEQQPTEPSPDENGSSS